MRCLVSVVVLLAACAAAAQVSPFEDVEWGHRGDGADGGEGAKEVRVFVRGEWYEPVAIEGTPFAALVAFAEQHYADRAWAQKRLDEDLLDVFEAFGAPPPPERVSLTLRPVDGGEGGEVVTLPDVLMTKENRNRLRDKRAEAADRAEAAMLAELEKELGAGRAEALLEALGALLAEKHSYSAVAAVRQPEDDAADGLMDIPGVVREVRRRLAWSGDGHARVGGAMERFARAQEARRGALPIACAPLDLAPGGRVVAVLPRGDELLDAQRPFLVAIDGVAIERWLEVAAEVAPGGSPASRRYWACNEAANVGWIRERLRLPARRQVTLRVASDGGDAREVELDLAERPARAWRPGPATAPELPDGVVYLAIPQMFSPDDGDGAWLARVREALDAAAGADAVIIDIRGNTGGTRDILHLLAPLLMTPDQAPVVYSAARVLMWPGRDQERVNAQLAGRRLFAPDSERWNEAERAAIGAFLAEFVPEVEVPEGRFGPLAVSMLSPDEEPGELAGKPVVVLMDERCISASDIFLCAMKQLPNVTLVGRPSRGASGMSERHKPDEALSVKISTMLSFMPDGRLFDWHGVAPDVPVELTPGDFCRGGPDTALEVAVKLALEQIGAGQAPPR